MIKVDIRDCYEGGAKLVMQAKSCARCVQQFRRVSEGVVAIRER